MPFVQLSTSFIGLRRVIREYRNSQTVTAVSCAAAAMALGELLTEAYRLRSPRRLAAQLDAF